MKTAQYKEKELTIPDTYIAVYNIIANSKEKYVTRKQILAQLGKKESYSRALSEIIYNLVVVHKFPIGASSRAGSKGYFIIKTEQDKYIAMSDLSARVDTISERYRTIQNIKIQTKGD